MTPTNYVRHFKVLGKICRLYDVGGPDVAALKLLISRVFDQIATGEVDSYDALLLLTPYMGQLNASLGEASTQVKFHAVQMAGKYLTSPNFYGDLTTVPSNVALVTAVLTALRTDMSAAVDNKRLSTESTSGLVNFFSNVLAAGGTWNTVADASADYKDSVYVVDTIVP